MRCTPVRVSRRLFIGFGDPFVIEPAAGSGPNRSSKGTDLRVPSQLDRAVHRPQGD